MKVTDLTLLDKVSSEAKESPRLRMNYNFHQSLEDKCHRMLNARWQGDRYCFKNQTFWIKSEAF